MIEVEAIQFDVIDNKYHSNLSSFNLLNKQVFLALQFVYVQNLILFQNQKWISISFFIDLFCFIPCIKCLNKASLSSFNIKFGHHFNIDRVSIVISCKLGVFVNASLHNNHWFTKLKLIFRCKILFCITNYRSILALPLFFLILMNPYNIFQQINITSKCAHCLNYYTAEIIVK